MKEKQEIKITEDTREQVIYYKNKAKEVVVNIAKIDRETKEPVAGAVLILRNEKGEIVEKFTTTNEPKVFLDLEYGLYTVEEESAPAGYVKSEEKISFIIDEDHESHQIYFENEKEVIVPNTMSTQGVITLILGSLLLAIAAGFVYKHAKKQEA